MDRIQFYPSKTLAAVLSSEAAKSGVSISRYVTDILEQKFLVSPPAPATSITNLTKIVLNEVEEYLSKINGRIEFDLTVSPTYREIAMVCDTKPRTVRASIGRSFASRVGKPPFSNVKKLTDIKGNQQLSKNNALMYEKF